MLFQGSRDGLSLGSHLLLNRGHHFVESVHFRLNQGIYIVHMLQRGFFEIYQALLSVGQFHLDNVLSAEHKWFDFFQRLPVRAQLVTQQCCLLVKTDLRVLFRPSDNLIHRLKAFLDLFHQSPLTLKTLPFIVAKLIKKTQHSVFQQLLDLSLLWLSLLGVLLHFSLNLLQDLLDHRICFGRLVSARIGFF